MSPAAKAQRAKAGPMGGRPRSEVPHRATLWRERKKLGPDAAPPANPVGRPRKNTAPAPTGPPRPVGRPRKTPPVED